MSAKELRLRKVNYTIETLWNAIWAGSPIFVTLTTFFHYTYTCTIIRAKYTWV